MHHKSIVPIYRVGEEQDRHFIAMEYVEGLTLADTLLERRASLRDSASARKRLGRIARAMIRPTSRQPGPGARRAEFFP